MPSMPKPTQESKDLFASVVPDHPAVVVRPMFGQLSAFVHGNMFMGIFGEDVFVRLGERDRAHVLEAGGGPFEPMAGRPMREYVVVPRRWRPAEIELIREYALRALSHAEGLPAKPSSKTGGRKKA